MAIKHNLAIEILPVQNRYVLTAQDVSLYLSGSVINNGVLEITPPKGTKPVKFVVTQSGFTKVITASMLGWSDVDGKPVMLPDGIYTAQYYLLSSINTPALISPTLTHLRTNILQHRIDSLLSEITPELCEAHCKEILVYPHRDLSIKQRVDMLFTLNNMLQVAVVSAGVDTQKSLSIYNYICDRVTELEVV